MKFKVVMDDKFFLNEALADAPERIKKFYNRAIGICTKCGEKLYLWEKK